MNESQRFGGILLISSVIHLLLIFTVAWSLPDPAPTAQTLEITLAQFKSDSAPEDADFLAQANQEGSGTLDEKAELSTLEQANFQANEIRKVAKPQNTQSQKQQEQQSKEVITSLQRSTFSEVDDTRKENTSKQTAAESQVESEQRMEEIASLEAELRMQRQAFARRPRRKQLTAVSARASADAAYLHTWRQKIESVGNMNYPDVDLYGSLTLLVAIRADGTVEKVEVRRSSGYKVLDDAAKSIVRLAAPFDPFPEAIRKNADVLEIIRTWQFDKSRYLSSF